MKKQSDTLLFEEAMDRLEESVKQMRDDSVSLEEAVRLYEDCVRYHKICKDLLKEAKRKVELYRMDTGEVVDFEEEL